MWLAGITNLSPTSKGGTSVDVQPVMARTLRIEAVINAFFMEIPQGLHHVTPNTNHHHADKRNGMKRPECGMSPDSLEKGTACFYLGKIADDSQNLRHSNVSNKMDKISIIPPYSGSYHAHSFNKILATFPCFSR